MDVGQWSRPAVPVSQSAELIWVRARIELALKSRRLAFVNEVLTEAKAVRDMTLDGRGDALLALLQHAEVLAGKQPVYLGHGTSATLGRSDAGLLKHGRGHGHPAP